MALGAAVCHTVDPLVQTIFLANAHCNELLVWFRASGFWYTINTGPSLKLLLVALSHGDPVTVVPQDQSLHVLQQITDGVDVGVSQVKAWV